MAFLNKMNRHWRFTKNRLIFFCADFVGNPAINFINAKGKQNKDGSFALNILGNVEVLFTPNKPIDLSAFAKEEEQQAEHVYEYKVEKIK